MSNKIQFNKNYYKELVALHKYANNNLTSVTVSAIIVTDKGVFKGINFEDAVCSLSICAERNAIFNAITNGMKKIYEIHLLPTLKGLSMCGACIQLAYSFGGPNIKVFNYDLKTKKRTQTTLGKLLPEAAIVKTTRR